MENSFGQPMYKYMERRHLRSFLQEGLIRIGTLYDFRSEETHGSEIGEDEEGTKTLTSGEGPSFIDTARPETIPPWEKKHIENSFKLMEGGSLQIFASKGSRVRLTTPNRYVYCASSEFDCALIKNGEYNACLEISNPLMFFKAISNKLKHKASWGELRRCTYRPRTIYGGDDDDLDPCYIKETRYEYQKEVRAVWISKDTEITPVIIKVKKARRFCRILPL